MSDASYVAQPDSYALRALAKPEPPERSDVSAAPTASDCVAPNPSARTTVAAAPPPAAIRAVWTMLPLVAAVNAAVRPCEASSWLSPSLAAPANPLSTWLKGPSSAM
ncbi:MAG TPA: hypothetical protein VIV06_10580 [Candidatus Limnocylindrales bacterium]